MILRAVQTPKIFKFGIKMEYLMQKNSASENDSAVTGGGAKVTQLFVTHRLLTLPYVNQGGKCYPPSPILTEAGQKLPTLPYLNQGGKRYPPFCHTSFTLS